MLRYTEFSNLPFLDAVLLEGQSGEIELYEGRKWVSGRFDRNIGIDQPTSGAGKTHAHVYGRKGDEIVVVNIDGTSSHGTKGRLSDDDAAALTARGFKLPPGNIVEWFSLNEPTKFILLG